MRGIVALVGAALALLGAYLIAPGLAMLLVGSYLVWLARQA